MFHGHGVWRVGANDFYLGESTDRIHRWPFGREGLMIRDPDDDFSDEFLGDGAIGIEDDPSEAQEFFHNDNEWIIYDDE
ncbi:MAG: hypothetical protein ACYTE0_11005 [Planctomycetota bacterium]|jgi:hypothetical protein